MNPEIMSMYGKESLREDGMLFVRTEGILETMVKAPLIIAGLIVVALTMPIQTSFGSTRMLDLTLYSDGSAHISSQLEVDPLDPDYEVSLFGSSIDNFVVVGENGFLLSSEIIDDKAMIDTFGSSSVSIDYDIHEPFTDAFNRLMSVKPFAKEDAKIFRPEGKGSYFSV